MRVKLDENMPAELPAILREMGHDADSVLEEGLSGRNDDTVWLAAQEEQRLLITQDLDFSDLRNFIARNHCGLILVRLRSVGRRPLIGLIQNVFASEEVEGWAGAFVVLTEGRVRVRRPAKPVDTETDC